MNTAKNEYLAAVEREAEQMEDVRQLEHASARIEGLRVDAQQRLSDAEAAKVEAAAAIKAAALEGKTIDPETREELTAAEAVIVESQIQISGLGEELKRIETSRWEINAEIMAGRRHIARLREGWHREAAGQAISKMVNGLDGVPLEAVAAHLECPVYRLQHFAKG